MHDIDRTQLEYTQETAPFQQEEFEFGEEPDISPAPRAGANRCPNCAAPIPAPFESKYLSGHLVQHHWRCQRCNVSWKSRFDPMLA